MATRRNPCPGNCPGLVARGDLSRPYAELIDVLNSARIASEIRSDQISSLRSVSLARISVRWEPAESFDVGFGYRGNGGLKSNAKGDVCRMFELCDAITVGNRSA
jgi:hypothetical protein